MAKHVSRRNRLEKCMQDPQTATDRMQTLIATIEDEAEESKVKTPIEFIVAEINHCENLVSYSVNGVEELLDEMTTWRDNMDNANMTHLPKYDEVSECCDALETTKDELENIEWPTEADISGAVVEDVETVVEFLQEIVDALENATSEADNVSFPGMF
jgi:molecular chaperone GrpE (heat shock protein)